MSCFASHSSLESCVLVVWLYAKQTQLEQTTKRNPDRLSRHCSPRRRFVVTEDSFAGPTSCNERRTSCRQVLSPPRRSSLSTSLAFQRLRLRLTLSRALESHRKRAALGHNSFYQAGRRRLLTPYLTILAGNSVYHRRPLSYIVPTLRHLSLTQVPRPTTAAHHGATPRVELHADRQMLVMRPSG